MAHWNVTNKNGIVSAAYNDPPMNYFTTAGTTELAALIEEWCDPAVKVVILTGGVPGKFITHYSVEELLSYAEDRDELRRSGTAFNDDYHALLNALQNLPKPVIAAMNGDTMGGGFELALACDIRIAARGEHRIGFPEVKVGLLPGGAGTQRLPRLIGVGRALDFILRGSVVDPDYALALGLVHELADDAAARALELADELSRLSAFALAAVKRCVYASVDTDFATGQKLEAHCFADTLLTDEGLAKMRSYIAVPPAQRGALFGLRRSGDAG
ncbi:enoyl-CoA hydratase/isomerase family protein [Pseudomonas sp. NPDC087697]|uniref:enoyl-CoA hydratase/isomerase family protein n=1 Tax=Pseudomonas sp. NPDC087697 TaxID=3364447 RepID=UPI003823A186